MMDSAYYQKGKEEQARIEAERLKAEAEMKEKERLRVEAEKKERLRQEELARQQQEREERQQKLARENEISRKERESLYTKYGSAAENACKSAVQHYILHVYDPIEYRWGHMSNFRRRDEGVPSVLGFIGSNFKIKDDFGTWRKMEYSCDYNVNTKTTDTLAWMP